MNTIKSIERLNEEELRQGITGSASWHADYSHSAYIHISGLSYAMNEGDIISVFSQCGEIVDCNLVRDNDTGDSKGFAFIAYNDQRSTVLAIDNFNAAKICGRTIKVDHVSQYKVPKRYNESEEPIMYNPTGNDGAGWKEFRSLTKEGLEKHNKIDVEAVWERGLMEKCKAEIKVKQKEKQRHKKHREGKRKTKSEAKKVKDKV